MQVHGEFGVDEVPPGQVQLQLTPFPLSAVARTRSSGPGSSSGTSGHRIRDQTVAGPGEPVLPRTGRHSMAERYPPLHVPDSAGPAGAAPAGPVSAGSSGGAGSCAGTGPLLVRSTRQAAARATSRPAALATASSSSTLRPGRASRAVTCSSPTGIARRISQVNLATIMSSRGAQRCTARPSSAQGGPPCWAAGSHGPVVCGVASQRSPPSGT